MLLCLLDLALAAEPPPATWVGLGMSLAGPATIGLGTAWIASGNNKMDRAFRVIAGAVLIYPPGIVMTEIGPPLLLSGAMAGRDPWQPAWAGRAGWVSYGLHLGLTGIGIGLLIAEREDAALAPLVAGVAALPLALTFGLTQTGIDRKPQDQIPTILVPIAAGRW